MIPLDQAFLLSSAVSLTGVLARALTPAGGATACLVGALVLAGTGWPGAAALGAFFLTSSLVSKLTERHQPAWTGARGNRRDPVQVLANGGTAALGGVIGMLGATEPGLAIVAASLAAAAADTWATAVGALSRSDPIRVVGGGRVPRGTSGGVSLIGTLGGLAGSGVVATAVSLAVGSPAPAVLAIGTLGMVADSVLGATVQGRFECPACGVNSERTRHHCGETTVHRGGWRWLGNDGVNLLATALAGFAGLVLWAASA